MFRMYRYAKSSSSSSFFDGCGFKRLLSSGKKIQRTTAYECISTRQKPSIRSATKDTTETTITRKIAKTTIATPIIQKYMDSTPTTIFTSSFQNKNKNSISTASAEASFPQHRSSSVAFFHQTTSYNNNKNKNNTFRNICCHFFTTTTKPLYMPLDEFRDPVPRDTRMAESVGRPWSAKELRLKSYEDLHKLWIVLYKERNMLLTEQQLSRRKSLRFPQPERIKKVRKSMGAIKQVLGERKRAHLANLASRRLEETKAKKSIEIATEIQMEADTSTVAAATGTDVATTEAVSQTKTETTTETTTEAEAARSETTKVESNNDHNKNVNTDDIKK